MKGPSAKLGNDQVNKANPVQSPLAPPSSSLAKSQTAALKAKPSELLKETGNKPESAVLDSKTQSPVGGSLNDKDPIERGQSWYKNFGCIICHSTDGSDGMGPTWSGIWGKQGTNSENKPYKVDEKFIGESVRKPSASIAQGYQNIMPPFDKGQLSDEQIKDLINFMQSISK